MEQRIAIAVREQERSVFERNYHFWERHSLPISVWTPKDSPIFNKFGPVGSASWCFGESGHCGPKAAARVRTWLNVLSSIRDVTCTIFEYDSICLLETIPVFGNGLYCIPGHNEDMRRFLAPRFALPPWTLNDSTANTLLDFAIKFKGMEEEGYADRYLGALAHVAGVPILSYPGVTFVRNTIQREDEQALREALRLGCGWIHGIKDQWVVDIIDEHLRCK